MSLFPSRTVSRKNLDDDDEEEEDVGGYSHSYPTHNDNALTDCHRLFQQYLLAHHCLSEGQARKLWNKLWNERNNPEDEDDPGRSTSSTPPQESLEEALQKCNVHLEPLRLQIRGISMPISSDSQHSLSASSPSSSSSKGPTRRRRYIALLSLDTTSNKTNASSNDTNKSWTTAERLYWQQIVKCFCEHECRPVSQATLLNLYTKVVQTVKTTTTTKSLDDEEAEDETHDENDPSQTTTKKKALLTLSQAETLLQQWLTEKWLQRTDKKGQKSSSLQSSHVSSKICLAPRFYMECEDVLIQEGIEADHLPQPIYYHV